MSWYKLKTYINDTYPTVFRAGNFGATTILGDYSYSEGTSHSGNTSSTGVYTHNHIENWSNGINSGKYNHVEGRKCGINGTYSYNHIQGYKNGNIGCSYSHVEGYNNTVRYVGNSASHTEGESNKNYYASFMTGKNNVCIEGYGETNTETYTEGFGNVLYGSKSRGFCFGSNVSNNGNSQIEDYVFFGQGGTEEIFYDEYVNESAVISYNYTKLVSIARSGYGTYMRGTSNTTGADYAEMFEWADGNPNDEDRVGLFVTLCNGNKIRIANSGDTPIGVVSATPAIIGDNNVEMWKNKYLTDEYGRLLYDFESGITEYVDESGNTVYKPNGDLVLILDSEYDSGQTYVSRSERPEWDAVGFMGKLRVNDDGSCVVGEKCTVGDNGIATAGNDYYVIERNSNKIITILSKFL